MLLVPELRNQTHEFFGRVFRQHIRSALQTHAALDRSSVEVFDGTFAATRGKSEPLHYVGRHCPVEVDRSSVAQDYLSETTPGKQMAPVRMLFGQHRFELPQTPIAIRIIKPKDVSQVRMVMDVFPHAHARDEEHPALFHANNEDVISLANSKCSEGRL